MHKLILKTFSFVKNVAYFLKLLSMFFLMLHLLFWIQNIISAHFNWLNPFAGMLNFVITMSGLISNGAIDLFGAVFEYKYMIAVVIYVVFYFICNLIINITEKLEDKYDDVHRYVKKSQEQSYNKKLKTQQEQLEAQINNYKIFIKTSLKKKFSHKELGYNLNEQNALMNKFLTERTGVLPILTDGGFIYSYNDFNNVDNILQVMFKLIKSNSPLDYVICLQVIENNENDCMNNLKLLSNLEYANKISMLADSAYRYKFNKAHRYGTSPLGLFQKEDKTLEVHEFVEL